MVNNNTCKTCHWYHEEVCYNGDSEHLADFRLEDERCEKWEENDETERCTIAFYK